MEFECTITDFQFHPMVEVVPSDLCIWFKVNRTDQTIMVQFSGPIEALSVKFGFIIEGPHSWDFTGFKGRKCLLRRDEDGYHLVRFIED